MGKQGGELKWWGSTSSTVLLDPAAFVESWKQQIQGKDGIPPEHQRLIFAYRVATQEGLSYTCKRSDKCPRAKECVTSDFLKELRGWKALLKSNNHVIAKLFRPLVAAEDEEIASHLYCETARELRDIGIPCNVYYLFFDKWLLAAPLEDNKCCKISSNINIQIDKDFQTKRFEILLFGRLNGYNLPVPFVYRMNGGEVAAQVSMHHQTAKYRQGHQMRRLGLNNQSVGKEVEEGRDSDSRTPNGSHESVQHENQYIPCGKGGLELTAIVAEDRCKYIVLTVIQVPSVSASKRLESATPHLRTVQGASEWTQSGSKAEGEPDCSGSCLSACTTTANHCDIYSRDRQKTVVALPPITSSHPGEHPNSSSRETVQTLSSYRDTRGQNQLSSSGNNSKEGNAEEMETDLLEVRIDSVPNGDEPTGKHPKSKRKKRKGKKNSRSATEGNSVSNAGVETLPAEAGADLAGDRQTASLAGVKVQVSSIKDVIQGNEDRLVVDQKFSRLVDDTKEISRKDCVSGERGEHAEGHVHPSPSSVSRADVLDLESVSGVDGLDAVFTISSLDTDAKQVDSTSKNEREERAEVLADAGDIKDQSVHDVRRTGEEDALCSVGQGCGITGGLRETAAIKASPDRCYTSTSRSLPRKLGISQSSSHIINVVDLASVDEVLQHPLNPENSVCRLGESGNLEIVGAELNHSVTKNSVRGAYGSGPGSRNGRGGGDSSSNRGYGRESEERRSSGGNAGGGGQGSGGSGQGTGLGSSGIGGSGGGGGGSSGGGKGNRGGGGCDNGRDWGRAAEGENGIGSKEGDSDERSRHSFQTGGDVEIVSDSLQRKKLINPSDSSRSVRKVTGAMEQQLANGTGNVHVIPSGTGKENSHSLWQKVQKPAFVEEVVDFEQPGEILGSHKNERRIGLEETNYSNRPESKARPSLTYVNGNLSHEAHQDKASSLEFSEDVKQAQDSSALAKSCNTEALHNHTELSTGGPRRVKDGLAASINGWQKKISWDDQRQQVVAEVPQHSGPSKGQSPAKQQMNLRSVKSGVYTRGPGSNDQQKISHVRSYSAPSTPNVFEESYSDGGEFSQLKSVKHTQGPAYQSAGPSAVVGQTEQVTAQISLRPHTSHYNSSITQQPGEGKPVSDELSQRSTSWKGRKPAGDQERPLQREKSFNDRERSLHCAQKWVPVEHKSSGILKSSHPQAKGASVSASSLAPTNSRDNNKEHQGVSTGSRQSVVCEEKLVTTDGILPCTASSSLKGAKRSLTFPEDTKIVPPTVEHGFGPTESAAVSETASTQAEQANLRSLLPREKIVETPAPVLTGRDKVVDKQTSTLLTGSVDADEHHHTRAAQKFEITPKASASGEKKSIMKKDPRRDLAGPGGIRPEPSTGETQTRNAVREVLDAVSISCRGRQTSEKAAGILGSYVAEFEKVLAAVAPTFVLSSDPLSSENGESRDDGSEGDLRVDAGLSETHEVQNSVSGNGYSSTPISSVWQWYEDPSFYGVEVRSLDSHRGLRESGEHEPFLAYFVPYLSGLQLFGYSSTPESTSRDPSGCIGTSVKLDSSSTCHPRPFQANEMLAKLLPTPGKGEETLQCQRSDGSSDVPVSSPCKNTSTKDWDSLDTRLLYEFFDADQPQMRQPFCMKVKELAKGVRSMNAHCAGNAAALDDLCLGDLHPASWFAVAWYPIYRIPEGPLRTVFLTYHSFHHMTSGNNSPDDLLGGGFEDVNEDCFSLPVVGMEYYNSQAETWFSLKSEFQEVETRDVLGGGTAAQCLKDRLRSLKEVAGLMAKGIPADRSREGSSGSESVSKFKHCDYEFFLKRRR
ncbi:hypothetical protein R1sor_019033 [Riccia sorocarpa]|uniref:Ubiquitin-like domain-containing protein n=1 Tax=Riccia sorocarpa TaxID=122646 RepID=A0ABD3ICI4_9MARC